MLIYYYAVYTRCVLEIEIAAKLKALRFKFLLPSKAVKMAPEVYEEFLKSGLASV